MLELPLTIDGQFHELLGEFALGLVLLGQDRLQLRDLILIELLNALPSFLQQKYLAFERLCLLLLAEVSLEEPLIFSALELFLGEVAGVLVLQFAHSWVAIGNKMI